VPISRSRSEPITEKNDCGAFQRSMRFREPPLKFVGLFLPFLHLLKPDIAVLDKTRLEAQIPANPANHRTNSVLTGRRVTGKQQSGQAVTFARDSRFHRRFTWRPQLEYSTRTIRPEKR